MQLILATISGGLEALWRRWFGGWAGHYFEGKLPNWLYKIVESRGTQTVVNLIFLFGVFMINNYWMSTLFSSWLIGLGLPSWVLALVLSALFQFEFWSRGHGPILDEGRAEPTQETIDRYQKVWWAFVPNNIVPKAYWYGFWYDFMWTWTRYTYGLFLLVPFLWSFNILWLGLITAGIYSICWTLYERDNWIFKLFPFEMTSSPHQLAEIITGFVVGFWLMWF